MNTFFVTMSYTVIRPTWPPSATAVSTRRELYLRKTWSTLCKNSKAEHQTWSYRYWSTPTCGFLQPSQQRGVWFEAKRCVPIWGGRRAPQLIQQRRPMLALPMNKPQVCNVCLCVWVCGVHIWSRKIHLLILVVVAKAKHLICHCRHTSFHSRRLP